MNKAAESGEPRQPIHQVCLGLGSNIDPRANMPKAVLLLGKIVRIASVSSVWKTAAIGTNGPDFLNAALLAETHFSPKVLKHKIRSIEAELGRVRLNDKYAARTIDIDILIYDGTIIDPQVWEQAFLAVPVAELLPTLTHPDTGESIERISNRLRQAAQIQPVPDVSV